MIPAHGIRAFQWLFSFPFVLMSASLALAGNPDVIKASRNDVSSPLSQMAVGASFSGGGSDSQTPTARATGPMTNPNSDPVAAPLAGPLRGATSFLTTSMDITRRTIAICSVSRSSPRTQMWRNPSQ